MRLLEFRDAAALQRARSALRTAGGDDSHWFAPLPLQDGDDSAAHLAPRPLPVAMLLGGAVGAAFGWSLQLWAAVFDYPIDAGARPPNSTIAFVPAALELAVLGAALALVAAFLRIARVPRFHHPLFEIRAFGRVGVDRYFLAVADDVDAASLAPCAVHEVGHG